MFQPSREQVMSVLEKKGYSFFTKGDYNLNLIGVRDADKFTNKFDDVIMCFYKADGKWQSRYWAATTDAGFYWVESPMVPQGCGVLVPGQYRSGWRIGYHKGQYRALVQNKPVTLYRDSNRDKVIDKDKTETGMFGVNIHRAGQASVQVDKWSAACQVIAKRADFNEMMSLVDKAAPLWGKAFTYTLLERKDFD